MIMSTIQTIDFVKANKIHKFLWSLGGAHKGKTEQNQYSNFFEIFVAPLWLKSEGYNCLPVLGKDNYEQHIDIKYWKPEEVKKWSCDVKAPRLGPKGLFVGSKEFTNDFCIEDINKNGDPGSLHGVQNFSFYFIVDDYQYYLVIVNQKLLQELVKRLIATGRVTSSDYPETMSDGARKHKFDMYYRWFISEGKKDKFMFMPYQDLIESGVMGDFKPIDVTDYVHQVYDLLIEKCGDEEKAKDYLATFKYED